MVLAASPNPIRRVPSTPRAAFRARRVKLARLSTKTGPGLLVEGAPQGGQPGPGGIALEQGPADLSLQALDLLAQGGLGHEQPVGLGPTQMQQVSCQHESTQVPNLHLSSWEWQL